MKKNNKGFTLAELLIVVAIIAVLVAISIPIFSSQLEKSREATDIANIRSAYAEVVTGYLTDGSVSGKEIDVAILQKVDGWQTSDHSLTVQVGDMTQSLYEIPGMSAGGSATVGLSLNSTTAAVEPSIVKK